MSKHIPTKFDERVKILQDLFETGRQIPKEASAQKMIDIILAHAIDGTAKKENREILTASAVGLAYIFSKENPSKMAGAKFQYAVLFEDANFPKFQLGDLVKVSTWTAQDILRIVDWDYANGSWVYEVHSEGGLKAHIKEDELMIFGRDSVSDSFDSPNRR